MLFSAAPIKTPHVSGLFLLLQKQWNSSSTFFAEDLHSSYLESFYRLQGDKEGTKPYLLKLGSPILSDLESAGEICLRRFPEKIRRNTHIFCAIKDNKAEKTRIHFKLPKWINIQLANKNKNLFTLKNFSDSAWATYDESKESDSPGPWEQLLLSPFQPIKSENIEWVEAMNLKSLHHYRLAELILRNQNPLLQTHFRLSLIP
jgi:hypothetical protein